MSSTATKSASKSASVRTKLREQENVDHMADQIIAKTRRMAETLKKYPKPTQ